MNFSYYLNIAAGTPKMLEKETHDYATDVIGQHKLLSPPGSKGFENGGTAGDRTCPFCLEKSLERQTAESVDAYVLLLIPIKRWGCRKCCRSTRKLAFGWRLYVLILGVSAAVAFIGFVVTSAQIRRIVTGRPTQSALESQTHPDAIEGVRTNMGQLSPFEKMMVSKHQETMDNEKVIRLTRSNLGTPIIIKMIRDSNHDFNVSADAIIALKNAKVDEQIIFVMLDVSSESR